MNKTSKAKYANIAIVLINVLFVLGLLITEWQYIRLSNNRVRESNLDLFNDTNTALANTTSTYLTGESHLCRSWARHLNNNVGSMEEAVDFVRDSIVDSAVMGHVIYKDDLSGLSTRERADQPGNFAVSYSSLGSIFASYKEGMNITSSYINPSNGSRSLAFYTGIKLTDPMDPTKQVDAYLLRVVLLNNFKTRWTFPSGSFDHLEVAVIDESGSYIVAGNSFTGASFFGFYESYNPLSEAKMAELKESVTHSSGYLVMKNSRREDCYVSYSQISTSDNWNWTILTFVPAADILDAHVNWLVVILLAAGLGLLFAFDLAVFLILSKNLKEAAAVASKANKAKTDFLSTMSHDIRTPMNAIVGLTTIAKEEKNNPESTQKALSKIEQASSHLLTLINDILDISKIESGKLVINPLTFSIKELFESLLSVSHSSAEAKNIKLTYREHDLKEDSLCTDKLRLNQIYTNLLSNAIKYTNEGGSVEIDTYEFESEKEGCVKLVFKIKDTGIGMSKEYLEKMYLPFSRATDSRVNAIEGTGLGLAITKQMVDLMGGTIECESELEKGTAFTVAIDIPVDATAKDSSLEEQAIEDSDLSNVNVLVVEDNEINWEVISTLLEMNGISSERAENGKVALELLEDKKNENRYTIVFMDIQMPVMNGLDATRAIRKLDSDYARNVPIVAMTADAFSENVTECLNAGMNGHIAKPIDINLVLATIRKAKNG
jgi:signal transduction histidine kinase/CheY-like chemotaxis protein